MQAGRYYIKRRRAFLDVFHLESLESLPKIDESASDEGEEQMDLFLTNYKEQLDDEKD